MLHRYRAKIAVLLIPAFCMGCAGYPQTPTFDVNVNSRNQPTVDTIVAEVECELSSLLDDPELSLLADENYGFAAELDLEVQDSGALAPSFTFTPTKAFALDAALKLSKSRTQTFTTEMAVKMADVKKDKKLYSELCKNRPYGINNLAHDLGIGNTVRMGLSNPLLDTKPITSVTTKTGQFGGSVSFIVVRGLDSSGPTWTLSRFKGPGKLATLSRQNTDRITFAFAVEQKASTSKKKGPRAQTASGIAPNASAYLQSLTAGRLQSDIQDLKSQLNQ